jgi:hypothetical protein
MSTATAAPPNAKPISQNRMTLASITKGRQQRPLRMLLYGVEGVGKTTFAANAPAPIFLAAEDGTENVDVERFPSPRDWDEVFGALNTLTSAQHSYKTLAVDTVDWLEPLLWAYICKRDGFENIEAYGYGKGYATALDEWRRFLGAVERLRNTKAMNVIFLAHSWIKPFKNPAGEDYDRWELKLHNKAAGLLKEWCDVVGFGNHEELAVKDKRTKRVRGVSTGARLLFTTRTAAYDAKNRFDLPESMPLAWEDFAEAVKAHRPADPKALASECARKAKELGGEAETKAADFMTKFTDAASLAKLNDRLNALLADRQTAEEGQ